MYYGVKEVPVVVQPDVDLLALRLMRALENTRNVKGRAILTHAHCVLRDFICGLRSEDATLPLCGPIAALDQHLEERVALHTADEYREWWRQYAIIADACHGLLRGHIMSLAVRGDR